MTKRQKANQMLVALGLFMMSAIVLVFTIGLALLPAAGGTVVSPILGTYYIKTPSLGSPIADAILYILLPIPFILTLEGGVWRWREGLEMRKEALEYKPHNIWSVFATFKQFKDIINAVIFLGVFIVLIILLIHELWHFPKVISISFVLYMATVVVYLLTRKKFGKGWKAAAKKFRKGLPTYQLTEDGVAIKLFTMASKKHPDPPPVHIDFAEVDDLQLFTYTEAEAFLKYNIGPDLQLGTRQIKETVAYLKGEIPRPSVYTFGGAKSDCVLIRGPELFYMIAFDADDVSDLIQAYHAFKASTGKSINNMHGDNIKLCHDGDNGQLSQY
ncbi:MAG: hypothetical protein ACOYEJ_04145 [Mahellales bacterium]|jgi:hypothetical protein